MLGMLWLVYSLSLLISLLPIPCGLCAAPFKGMFKGAVLFPFVSPLIAQRAEKV
jgi:hypothetical protein